jgi:FkbM family methyltransferase
MRINRCIWIAALFFLMMCTAVIILPGLITLRHNVAKLAESRARARARAEQVASPIVYQSSCLNDRWAAECMFPDVREGGFFLESGCAGGKAESSTFVLETELGWKGACVEPNSVFYELARKERLSVFRYALGNETGEVSFFEANNPYLSGLPQTIESRGVPAGDPNHYLTRGIRAVTKVPMKTLTQVLREAGAPAIVHYVALDMEGAEYLTLQGFFADEDRKFTLLSISIEGSICGELLKAHDYVAVSNPWGTACPWEYYYVHRSAMSRANACLTRSF